MRERASSLIGKENDPMVKESEQSECAPGCTGERQAVGICGWANHGEVIDSEQSICARGLSVG